MTIQIMSLFGFIDITREFVDCVVVQFVMQMSIEDLIKLNTATSTAVLMFKAGF